MVNFSIVSLSVLVVVCIGTSLGQNASVMTSAQVTAAAIANFEKLKAKTLGEFNSAIALVKSADALIADTAKDIGVRLTDEYYLEGTVGLLGAADFIRSREPFAALTSENVVKGLPAQGVTAYKTCFENNFSVSNITKILTDLTQRSQSILTVDIAFKIAVAKCSLVKPDQASGCVANAMTQNPLPALTGEIINSFKFLNANLKCIGEASARINSLGSISLQSVRRVVPPEVLFILPTKFDVLEGRTLAQVSLIPTQNDKLSLARATLNSTLNLAMEAWEAKNINLASAKAYLDDVSNEFSGILGRLPAQPEAAFCLTNDKVSLVNNINAQGLALLQCVNNIQAPPTPQALQALELSLADRQLRESLGASTVQCFRNLKNVFYPTEMSCCIAEAQDDYNLFLQDVILSAETFARKSANIVALFNYCKITATAAAKKEFIEDTSTGEKCLKLNTKIFISPPVTNPYLTVNTTLNATVRSTLNVFVPNVTITFRG